VGSETFSIFGALFMKKNTKLDLKNEYLLRLLPGPWKGPMQVTGPED
jgi:hypothetical protein